MMFVLDTNVLSAFRKKRPNPAVVRWVARIGWQQVVTTVVTITEIQRGIERTRLHHSDVARETDDWLDGMLAVGEPQVLPLNVDAARLIGRMYETPSLKHFIITDPRAKHQATGADLAIAAIAIVFGATVATNNAAHFRQIDAAFPLPGLIDPFGLGEHQSTT
jgi:toxin FitB